MWSGKIISIIGLKYYDIIIEGEDKLPPKYEDFLQIPRDIMTNQRIKRWKILHKSDKVIVKWDFMLPYSKVF